MPYPQNTDQKQSSRLVNKFPFFYGWIILAVGTLGAIMTSPGQTYAVSIFIEHFIVDLGISRSLISTLYAGGTLAGSLALPLIGREIDRRGSRFMVVAIAGALGLACIYMGTVNGPLALAAGFVAVRMLGQGSLTLVSLHVINQWWVTRRGTIMGLSGLFTSLLGLGAFPNLINWLIPRYGWRTTYPLLGLLMLLIMVPAGYLFFRERPEAYGLQPDGPLKDEDGLQLQAAHAAEENWTHRETLRTPAFWIIATGLATIAMMTTGLFFHMVSIFADSGLSADVAASVYVPIAVTTALVTLSSGPLVDRIPLRFALSAALLLQASALWIAQFLTGVPLAFLYGIVLGTATGLFRIVSAVAWAHYFGREHLGSISGTATTISVFGAAMGPLPFGVARDLLGSYNGALSILSLLPLALGITSLLMSPPHKTE